MVLPALLLATSVALSFSPITAPGAGTHWHSPVAAHPGRGHPSDWYVLVRPQHRRLGPSAAPAQPRVLQPGLLLHSASERVGPWLRVFDSAGKSWVNMGNVRPAQEPRGWDKLVLKIHPILRPRVTVPPPLPVANTVPAASPGTVAATPQPVVVQQQVVVQPVVQQPAPVVRTPIQSIYFWAGQYGVNGDLLLRTAECESGLNAAAYNPSGASGGLQFMPSTFAAYAAQLQWDHAPSYWNFDDSARVAAYMWGQGQQGQWSCWYVTTQGYNPDNG